MKEGDTYVLWNLEMPSEYRTLAEIEYEEAVYAYIEDKLKDIGIYKGTTDYVELEKRDVILTVGQRIRLESTKYFPSTGYKSTRITKLTRNVNSPKTIDVEISDVLSTGTIDKINDDLTTIQNYTEQAVSSLPDVIKSWESTSAADTNLYSAKKSVKEFLSKLYDDTVQGIVTFLKKIIVNNIESSNFDPTLKAGYGITTDENGRSTLTIGKISAEEMAVDVYTYNEVQSAGGTIVVSKTWAEVSRVEVIDGVLTVYYIPKLGAQSWQVSDQPRMAKDGRYFWGVVTEVSSTATAAGEFSFTCSALAANIIGSADSVQEGDTMILYGHRGTDKTRQSITVISAGDDANTHPYIKQYRNIDSFDLTNLEDNNESTSIGYDTQIGIKGARSVYKTDEKAVYHYGDKIYFARDEESTATRMVQEMGDYIPGETYFYYQRVTMSDGSVYLCVAEGGTTDTPSKDSVNWKAQGADGKSAYELAVEGGFEGTESEWIESLKGDPVYMIYTRSVSQPDTPTELVYPPTGWYTNPDLAPNLSLSSSSKRVTADSGSFDIDVISNGDWTASESSDWLSVSPTSSNGNQTVTISYYENTYTSSRSGSIAFVINGICTNFTITQEAAAEATLAIYPATKVISSDSGSFIVDVTSNTDWTVNENLNWATVSPTSGSGNGSVTINYTENSSETTQRVGTITFAAGGKTASLAVTQTVAEPEVVQPTLSISASSSQIQVGGDSITAQITSNTSWYFAGFMTTGSSVGSPSFTVTPSSGEGDTTIEISLASGQDVSGLFQLAFEVNGDTSTYATLLLTVIAEPEVELADGVYPISFNGDWTPTDVFSTYFAFCDADGNETDATASASTSYYRFRDGLNDSELPSQTFRSCSVLTSIVIPDSVTSIAANAIDYCSALTTLSIPDSVTSIGNAAFQNNTSLTELVIPSGVSTLSSSLAFGCSSLTAVTLPEGVTTIGTGAFQNCSSLSSIAIPSTVSAINSYAFYSCSSLVSIDLSDHTMVPTLGTAAIRAIDGLQIFVPMLISPSFRNAANWSTLSSYIVGV
ncbi:MAG: leucine-rich repeat protein [Rikenellaceae bacterium]